MAVAASLLISGAPALPAGAADRVEPTYASAEVDGVASEWDAGDAFASLASNDPPPEVLAQVSLRYDCDAEVLFALVAATPGIVLETTDPDEAYLRLGDGRKLVSGTSGDDGDPPDFAWVARSGDTATGFEASAPLAPGDYPASLRVHAKVADASADGYHTLDLLPRHHDLVISCPTSPPPSTPPEDVEVAPAGVDTPDGGPGAAPSVEGAGAAASPAPVLAHTGSDILLIAGAGAALLALGLALRVGSHRAARLPLTVRGGAASTRRR